MEQNLGSISEDLDLNFTLDVEEINVLNQLHRVEENIYKINYEDIVVDNHNPIIVIVSPDDQISSFIQNIHPSSSGTKTMDLNSSENEGSKKVIYTVV